MKPLTKFLSLIFAAAFLFVAVAPAAAATQQTITFTESEANQAYRVKNPPRRTISNVYVDIQEGVVAITAKITFPKAAYDTVSVFEPVIKRGTLTWTLKSATVNGQPVPSDVLAAINASIVPAWRNYVQAVFARRIAGPFKVEGITLSGDVATVMIIKP
jgi:hypothetical protein